ncbi:SigE family RNA polymerase sigma factor [Streptomyces sp. NPDC002602]|uniref:SigE family RNA polymerase sigma factor n=1 Tax=Streptomyces sp. NPDC002602 TaxID=3364654 RepID=UPI0036A93998
MIPPRRRSNVPGGPPVIVPVPPTSTPSVVPTRGGRVPSPRDSAAAPGSDTADDTANEAAPNDAAPNAVEPDRARTGPADPDTAGANTAGADTEKVVVAGTTVDHLTETYQAHYRSLLGLAALLLDDTASCEDVVQEAFIRVHSARNRVRDRDKTLAYLRQTVVNLSRSALRRRILGLKLLSKPMPDMASAEEGAYDQLERDDLIKSMRGLQRRQREVLVLRYFADMTEVQVAETLGISLGSVKAYGSRGIAALRVAMEAAQS